jgi:hypothetical protein
METTTNVDGVCSGHADYPFVVCEGVVSVQMQGCCHHSGWMKDCHLRSQKKARTTRRRGSMGDSTSLIDQRS